MSVARVATAWISGRKQFGEKVEVSSQNDNEKYKQK